MSARFQRVRVPGSVVAGRYAGAPVHWHWSALIGGLLFSHLDGKEAWQFWKALLAAVRKDAE